MAKYNMGKIDAKKGVTKIKTKKKKKKERKLIAERK
jgi:hypothetical protein